ncbi:MAG: ATP synthase F1 subunit delta [Alphaproteobacteria bacterium RIFCSPHIGHO2_12_FULL_63_12]|nr:MAG: ATP synthase F1 subunit delta [Alphaproteobacteria bacterium RIFCSPHIGHO2_12_FULL_63_12]
MSSDAANSPILTGTARRYAEALFDLARDQGAVEKVEADLEALANAIAASADFRRFLTSPVYDSDDKAGAIAVIADKAGVSALTRSFLGVVAANRRLPALEGISAAFKARLAEHRGEVSAEAVAAAPLNDEQTKRLRGEIERVVGKAVNLTVKVDKDLLGGMVVKVGSTMIDSSLKTKLNRLKSVMKEA